MTTLVKFLKIMHSKNTLSVLGYVYVRKNMGMLNLTMFMKVLGEVNKLPANRFQMADKQTE